MRGGLIGMRVNLYGNVCNNAYLIAKFLRRSGVDAHLFVERGFPWLPEHDEPALAAGYPDWIHRTGDLRYRRYGLFDRSIVRLLADCDIIHTFYYGPIWARLTGRPFVFQNYGGDLSVLPFMNDSLHHRYLAGRQRRGIQAASCVFLTMPNHAPCTRAVTALGLTRIEFLPLPIDAERYAPLPEREVQRLRSAYRCRRLFFHPARHAWTEAALPADRKGNDRLLRAFARFVRAEPDALLLAIRHGPDVSASERLGEELGIRDHVRWLAPVRRFELIRLYNVADAVFDQFVAGDYGACAFEAWACGKPVFIYLKGVRPMVSEEPPAVNVQTEDEIYERLVGYSREPEALREIGRRARAWVLKHIDGDALIPRYLRAYRAVLERDNETVSVTG